MEQRNLDLSPRLESTREKNCTNVVKFDLDQIKQHFIENINSINAQFDVANELIELNKLSESENIWRSQIVFLASALDFYMHELTKYGLCEIFNENWDRTTKYDNITVEMKVIERALKAGEDIDWFLEYINGFYQKITMVSFDSIKDQLNLLGINVNNIANNAFYQSGDSEKTIDKLKRKLNELYNRRNAIAHQSDREHANAQIKSITCAMVNEFINDINKIVFAIDEEVRNKQCI